jgi:hypothetical protein
MRSNVQRRFGLIYWGLLCSVLVFLCYKQGKEEVAKSVFVKGKVIDQIWLPAGRGRNRRYVYRPQITFPVKDTSYIFTDERTSFENGKEVTVIYRKDSPRDAQVYTFWLWIDFGIIGPFAIIGGFVFSVILITFTKYGKKPVILRGEFDSFK